MHSSGSVAVRSPRDLIITASILCVAASAWAGSPRELVKRGNEKYREGEYAKAVEDYSAAAQDDPALIEALFNRAVARQREGALNEAEVDLARVAAFPGRPDLASRAFYNLGLVEHERLRAETPDSLEQALAALERAAQHFRSALDLAPEDRDAARNLEMTRRQIAALREVIEQFRQLQQAFEDLRDELKDQQQEQQEQAQQTASRAENAEQQQGDQPREQQQQLSDRTQQAQQRLEELREQSSGVRREVQDALSEAQQALEQAREAQQRAEQELEEGREQDAAESQSEAAERLGEAVRHMTERRETQGQTPETDRQPPPSPDQPPQPQEEAGEARQEGEREQESPGGEPDSDAGGDPATEEEVSRILEKEQRDQQFRRINQNEAQSRTRPVEKDW